MKMPILAQCHLIKDVIKPLCFLLTIPRYYILIAACYQQLLFFVKDSISDRTRMVADFSLMVQGIIIYRIEMELTLKLTFY